MKKLYLGVGINKYPDCPLRGCVNDVQSLFSALINKFGFKQGDNMRMLVDERATKAGILDRLNWLVSQAEHGDLCVFQYSGHGSQVPSRSDSGEVDGLDEIICPVDLNWDNGYITDNQLGEIMDSIANKGATPIFIFDSCHSGTITRDLVHWIKENVSATPIFFEDNNLPPDLKIKYGAKITIAWKDKFIAPPIDIQARMKPGLNTPDRTPLGIVVSGCKDDQTSADAYFGGIYNGAMTKSLIKILNDIPDLSWNELGRLLPDYVKRAGFEQIPSIAGPEALMNRKVFKE